MQVSDGEGYIPFAGHRTWYRIVGHKDQVGKLPVLMLHGGPGMPHGILQPLEAAAGTGRRVIFYDQLGCGNSSTPSDPTLWTIDLYVREVSAVRQALNLGRVHLFGHSWGGILALEYSLTKPEGLESLTIADAFAKTDEFAVEDERLMSELPSDVAETIRKHREAGTTRDPEYKEAYQVYRNRHFFRGDPWPEYLTRSIAQRAENPESAIAISAQLGWWDISDRLAEIRVPTLVTVGRYGHVTPAISETVGRGILGSRLVIFEESAHFAYIEEADRYLSTLDDFWTGVESAG